MDWVMKGQEFLEHENKYISLKKLTLFSFKYFCFVLQKTITIHPLPSRLSFCFTLVKSVNWKDSC